MEAGTTEAATTTAAEDINMGVRKNVTQLTDQEREALLRALLTLKNTVPGGSTVSIYDQFVALHGAVMAMRVPGHPTDVNFGHRNPGFCPWHRQYLLLFEKALQAVDANVTLPYWKWQDQEAAMEILFTEDFLGEIGWGATGPRPIRSRYFNFDEPNPKPTWYPATAQGWRIPTPLQVRWAQPGTPNHQRTNATLHRFTPTQIPIEWPPNSGSIIGMLDEPTFLRFRSALEAGWRTHNAGHNYIGGNMADNFSPIDPLFWLHHANVDRLWWRWQERRLVVSPGTTHADHYAPDVNPVNNMAFPPGHRLNDLMWPWVGSANGYQTAVAGLASLLASTAGVPATRVRDVLDVGSLGYSYTVEADEVGI